MRVLVVDDHRDTVEVIIAFLEHEGHAVHIARDVASALEAAAAHPPDVALIDLGLPNVDGFALAAQLRSARGPEQLKLISFTGYVTKDIREKSRAAGFIGHFNKPIQFDQLVQLLRTL